MLLSFRATDEHIIFKMADDFKFIKPPRIVMAGNEAAARQLTGFGLNQLRILKEAMGFQGLSQMQSTAKDRKIGVTVKCSSCFGNDRIDIHVPSGFAPEEIAALRVSYCWCNCCFGSGVIKEVIGDYGDPVGDFEDTYPDDLVDTDLNIQNYDGIRYKVAVCQKRHNRDYEDNAEYYPRQFVCIPSDFAEYHTGENVIVWLSKQWSGTGDSATANTERCVNTCGEACWSTDGACNVSQPWEPGVNNTPDGTFILMPLEFEGVNS